VNSVRGGVGALPECDFSLLGPYFSSRGRNRGSVLMVDCCIKVHLDLQADKSSVVVKGPFFP
jgi:hypothetical protein